MDHPKRKMKTPSQLEILERVYAEDKYPSEIVRSELSSQLSLTDRQVKMWFCHRRLKDRKINNEESVKKQRILELPPQHPGLSLDLQMRGIPQQQMPQPHHFLDVMHPDDRSFHTRQLPNTDAPRMGLPHNVSPLDCRLSVNAEVAAVRLVEEQLGEPLREDGPVLGYEFDPLPPGAFDTPIEHGNQWRGPPDGLHSDSKLHLARHDSSSKLSKALASEFSPSPTTSSSKRKATPFLPNAPIPAVSSRVPQEHQFIPEHPTGTHLYERKPDIYERKLDIPSRISPLPAFLPPAEPFGNGAPTLGLGFPPGALGDFRAFQPPEVQLLPPVRPPMSEKAIAGSERLIMLHEQEQARLERKRKAEEARLAKELEAQEKRMRKEVERQEALRRKKEEQERKELERLNKERQKELERLMRERAREEERIQKQHRKEFERMEKMMQKEHQRVEKLRQKEEMRREREASKMRAAYERATAKKLAKLSTGLMDDEQLELMQMGAFAQGLVSTGFDPSEVELSKFPPASVRMKPPVAVPPWIDSDHNVANLFMVWRMLTNFADVIGLWPFTIDEFIQALHDYDSRLLGEIHIALLKTLVKDVRDASNAPSLGNNQALSVACGGHPELVEAAYAWGFDIQEWGQHVNALTWPEILRQFALASGYGPRWKRRTTEVDLTTTITEGKNAEEAVANIRSGAAAENAVTQMRGKCSTRVKKQQQPQKLILTPGTVKYAAFKVLSIEGSKGLTVLEVVDRIQKAGLRDLTTSKTPEASISAVLSRDTKLFERVAPSTYCVRAMYRKNPEVAESVLQAALEKIDLYETEVLEEDVEEAEEQEREDEDEADEQELDELAENNNNINCTRTPSPSSSGKVILRLKAGKPSARRASECIEMNVDNAGVEDGMEIDESQVGEVWVQGLMEGEYTDLSVEERLSGLVALVEAVNQGNTVRSAIEERYEAASALKRQLWEEVQLDKRRIKEEAAKAEEEEKTDNGSQDHVEDANVSSEKRLDSQKSRAEMKADIRQRADKLYVIRSLPLGLDRRFNRYWQFVTCGNDPGCGRIYCESHADGHWEVMDTEEALNSLMNALDTRGIREADLFVSLKELEPSLRQAMAARSKLNLDLCDGSPSSGVVGSGKESLELVHGSITIENSNSGAIRRYKDMERWLWKYISYVKATQMGVKRDNPDGDNIVECETCHDMHWQYENHCTFCHLTGFEEDFTQHLDDCGRGMVTKEIQGKLPPRIQLLKKLLFLVEMHIPREAFKEIWPDSYRKAWCNRLKAASTAAEILQVFVDVESAIEQGWMSSTYETIDQVGSLIGNQKRNIPAWIPQTSAAVALRLMLFDAAIAYTNEQKEQFMFKQQKAPVKQKLVEEKIPEVYTGVNGGGEEVKAEAYGVNKGEGESEDSLNWDAQDSFEEPEHPQNGDGQLSEEEEEEEEQLSSDTDDNKNKDSHVVSGEGANVTDDED